MSHKSNTELHDAYAPDYDDQMKAYNCHITDVLFGLLYEFTQPGQILLDAGIGSGLSAQLFVKAGLEVHGMDFSRVMLDICQAKGFAVSLQKHDILNVPWPYPSNKFDHVVSCGVMHFIADLDSIFSEAKRVLGKRGWFAFTTKVSPAEYTHQIYDQQNVGEFEIYSHSPAYVESLLVKHVFKRIKLQRCNVSEDQFDIWIARN